jgi:hypothetical protein
MSMTKAEKNLVYKLEKEVEYWKNQAGLVINKQSLISWSNYSEKIFLPECGSIQFISTSGVIEASLLPDGIKVYSLSQRLGTNLCIFPECSNVITIKNK